MATSGSTLAQVMACCLTAPSHHLNQCWLVISKFQQLSSESTFPKTCLNYQSLIIETYLSKLSFDFARGQWVKPNKRQIFIIVTYKWLRLCHGKWIWHTHPNTYGIHNIYIWWYMIPCVKHRGRVMHVCVSKSNLYWFRLWSVVCSAPTHYLNQCFSLIDSLEQNFMVIYIEMQQFEQQVNEFENVVCKTDAIMSQPHCDD